MTPEREAEIRESIARGDVWERAVSELLAMLDRLRAEIDRLRALPVIATCGECKYRDDAGVHRESQEWCDHPRLRPGPDAPVSSDAAPPEWCPLRGAR